MTALLLAAAGILGGIIGYSFGYVQQVAQKRNQEKQRNGAMNSVLAVMPGSGIRIAYLLVLLFLVQLACPLFFDATGQWFVSGGVVLGYGWTLIADLKRKLAAR